MAAPLHLSPEHLFHEKWASTRTSLHQHFQDAANTNLTQSCTWANGAWHGWKTRNINEIKTHIKNLEAHSNLPGLRECAKNIQFKLDKKKMLENSDAWIDDTIESLLSSNNYRFIKFLREADEQGLNFSGMLHCEASLASLLKHSKDGTIDGTCEDICAQLKVGYAVSNLFLSSSPVFCDRVLDELLEYQNVAAQHVNISSPS